MQIRAWLVGGWCLAAAVTAFASGGAKKTAETCTDDSECARGHCYTKKNGDKVCVDCSPSTISDYRGQIKRFCKDEPRKCDNIPATEEASEDYFKIRIENGERCITARDRENRECWDGADAGHREQLDDAEKVKKNCYDELNTRRGNGGIYTCSESTYSSRASDANNACSSYGNACDEWSKDDTVVDCGKIESTRDTVNKCIEAVERLDSDCLPRLSSRRESQFGKAKKAYDTCKEILDFKKDKKLCK